MHFDASFLGSVAPQMAFVVLSLPLELHCPRPHGKGMARQGLLGWGWQAPDSLFLSCSTLKLNLFSIAYLELESLVSKPGLL